MSRPRDPFIHRAPAVLAGLTVQQLRSLEIALEEKILATRTEWQRLTNELQPVADDLGYLAGELSNVKKELGPRALAPLNNL